MDSKVKHLCQSEQAKSNSYSLEIVCINSIEGWFLKYRSIAIAQDVENGEADNIGESMGEICLRIEYCPFCGKKL